MADLASIIKSFAGEDGSIPAADVAKLTEAVFTTVSEEFVEKKRYNGKLLEIETLKTAKQNAEDNAETARIRAENLEATYKTLQTDFENFKTETKNKETRASKEVAYRELLQQAGINEKRIDTVLKYSDVDGVELDKSGKIKGADKLAERIRADFPEFVVTTEVVGAETPMPQTASRAGAMAITKDEIFKIQDASERQKAIAENHELFGF